MTTTTAAVVLLATSAAYLADVIWHRHHETRRTHRVTKAIALAGAYALAGASVTAAFYFIVFTIVAAHLYRPDSRLTRRIMNRTNNDETEAPPVDEANENDRRRAAANTRAAQARTQAAEARADAAESQARAAQARAIAAAAKAEQLAQYAALVTPVTQAEIDVHNAAHQLDADHDDHGQDEDEDAWLEARATEADRRNRRTIAGRTAHGIIRDPNEPF
jgi:hypothetical protein